MAVPLTSIHPLVMTHILVAEDPSSAYMFAAFNAATDAWPDYPDRLLGYICTEFGKAEDSEQSSMLLMHASKDCLLDLEDRKVIAMSFIGKLIVESGLDAVAFADLAGFSDKGRNVMIQFAQVCIDGRESNKEAKP